MTTPDTTSPLREYVTINDNLRIPAAEIRFTAARGGGPGGQHVNKVNTRITLLFDVAASPSLTDDQRRIIMEKLAGRINQEGTLYIIAGEYRSQAGNKAAALTRFKDILRQALTPRVKRRKTRPSLGSKLKRLESKTRRGATKRLRRVTHDDS